MNFVFVSPQFPSVYWRFCAALRRNGARVLGIGDTPYDQLAQEVTDALNERIETRLDAFEGYAPEEAKKLENANQSVRGEFIFFAVSSQAEDYRAAFDRSL